jgi:hypothetical protein
MNESIFELNTKYGIFKMWLSNDIDIDRVTRKQIVIGKTLALGAKNKCLYITIPNTGDTAHLHNVKTADGGCEVQDAIIKGEKTVGMINLAFNIIKLSKPNIKYVTLDDRSNFMCYIGDNKYLGVSLNAYNFLFYQQTWYEKNFGAYLQDEKLNNEYIAKKENFYKRKPANFYFNNIDLDSHKQFLYNTTPDWKTFFDLVHKLENPCRVILPWYKSAISNILGTNTYFEETWIIDLYKIPTNHKDPYIPTVTFTGKQMKGGSHINKTYKNKHNHLDKIIKKKYMSSKDELRDIKFSNKELKNMVDMINKMTGSNIKHIDKPPKNITIKNKNKNIHKNKDMYYHDNLYTHCFEELYNMKFSKKELEEIMDISKEYKLNLLN